MATIYSGGFLPEHAEAHLIREGIIKEGTRPTELRLSVAVEVVVDFATGKPTPEVCPDAWDLFLSVETDDGQVTDAFVETKDPIVSAIVSALEDRVS